MEYTLEGDVIPLNKLLKLLKIAQTGGHAKILIEEGEVILNGEVEHRIRKKIYKGDLIELEGQVIKII